MLDNKSREELLILIKKSLKIRENLRLGTKTLTPLNYNFEKEKFFNSDTYNPIFMYKHKETEEYEHIIEDLKQRLKKVLLPEDLKTYVNNFLSDLDLLAKTNDTIGTAKFSEFSSQLFHWKNIEPDKILKRIKLPQFKKDTSSGLHDAKEIQKKFISIIHNRYHIDEFTVETDTFNDMTIRAGSKKITIGERVKRTGKNLKRLVVHEVESHFLQNYNLSSTKNSFTKTGFYGDSILFAEGLAVYNEIQTKTITKRAFETYKYRLLAASMIDKSFREIYTYLTQFISPDRAYMITYRVKRGLSDTSKSGGFIKDSSYLVGYTYVLDYVNKGGDIKKLYSIKVPQLEKLLSKYSLYTPQEVYLPQFVTNND